MLQQTSIFWENKLWIFRLLKILRLSIFSYLEEDDSKRSKGIIVTNFCYVFIVINFALQHSRYTGKNLGF